MSVTYAKGSHPQDLDAAKGGLVLNKLQKFSKTEDGLYPLGTGQNGPENTSDFGKGKKDPQANRTGTKSLKAITPR